MAVECGIVGLPNVGKSTLFNSLTLAQVPAENFPFCTVDPHRGVVNVPDPRLDKLAEIGKSQKIIPAMVTFVDIAGLVKGAAAGEGLGNQFLSHIREVNAIVHVVRCFEDPNIIHVMGSVDPKRDVEIIDLELCLSDLETAKKRLEKAEKNAKAGSPEARAEAKAEVDLLKSFMEDLSKGLPLRRRPDLKLLQQDMFLTSKPVLFVANISENDVKNPPEKLKEWIKTLEEVAKLDDAHVLPMCVGLEQQLVQLTGEDRKTFYDEYGITEAGLNRLIREAYSLLGLITYFTVGPKEARAWTINRGTLAPGAAGVIHSDFERGFIRAETIAFSDYEAYGGEKGAREKGLMRSEGKEYEVKDGDVILFKFGV